MKRLLAAVLALVSVLCLSACKDNVVEIDKIYQEPENEIQNCNNAIKSSCAISRSDVTFSGTVIDYDSKEGAYYIISYSELGSISLLKNNVEVYPDASEDYYSGKIIGLDSKNSLSLVKVNAPAGTFSVVNKKDGLTLAEDVFTVSTPLALNNNTNYYRINSITSGIISRIDSYSFQTSAPMNTSSYGGGVYDYSGNFIGILVDKTYSSVLLNQYVEGTTNAIMAKYVYKSYEDMKSSKEVKRTSLGITVTQWHKGLESVLGYTVNVPDYDYTYVVVTDVDSDGNCNGKFQKNDLIDYINGVKVYSNTDLGVFIHYAKIGDTLNFKIKRYNSKTNSFSDIDVDVVLIK